MVNVTVPSFTVAVEGLFAATVADSVTPGPPIVPLKLAGVVVVVGAEFTVWLSAPALLRKLCGVSELPLYPALMVCDPCDKDGTTHVACALPFSTTALQSTVDPSLKVTVPVGVPVAGATVLTVAVNVTDCPKTDGFALELTLVVVEACAVTVG